jgi:hypothetical protein
LASILSSGTLPSEITDEYQGFLRSHGATEVTERRGNWGCPSTCGSGGGEGLIEEEGPRQV